MTEGVDPSLGTGNVFGKRPNVLAHLLSQKRPLIMGVLNVTPDSFSDGGQFVDPNDALRQAQKLIKSGADIIDIGGESTRPYGGSKPITLEEELGRLQPVLSAVIGMGAPVSIDTMKPEVALWALGLGASIVNDVWGLQRDPNMARVVAEHGVPVICMHNRYKADPTISIMSDINAFFDYSIDVALKAGILRDCIVLDPGIGFGKTPEQSMEAIAKLESFKRFKLPILVGASRKRFIDTVSPAPPLERIGGSLAAHLIAVRNGASIIRTHDVAETIQAIAIDNALRAIK
ncbi:dihydropteroate synthase [Rhodoplanes sp. Z2-YC6860]|uniref:dihydropteroate synthase n=1 Tax=Rhodoplanes sp. Z2-YC6860 TaxID=674703 RepID=UPI00082A0164